MDLRTKFVFALVFVALASMGALGVAMYVEVDEELQKLTVDQLEGVADFKVASVGRIVAGWHDRVSLVASRTQLRESLDEYTRRGSEPARARIERILGDALATSPLLRQLVVHDRRGAVVARAGPAPDRVVRDHGLAGLVPGAQITRYVGVAFHDGRVPTISFIAPLQNGGRPVGYLHVALSSEELADLAANYGGLGETGETLIVGQDASGTPRMLHPVRNPPPDAEGAGLIANRDAAAMRSLAGDEVELTDGVLDYRGEDVWAASRFVPETGWGVAVKIDEAEQAGPIEAFRNNMIRMAVILAAFPILFGAVLGIRFAQPIHVLSEAANRIREGHLEARANITQEDEVGQLARTFDEMASELESQVGLLSEYMKFFDVSLDMLCIASTDGYFKRVNRAFVRELGWSEEELLTKPYMSFVHPDDYQATTRVVARLAKGTPTIRFENRFLCLDGSYKPLRWNAYPEEETGRLYAIARVRSPRPEEPS